MGVASAGDVFGRRAEFHGDRRFGDHGLGVRPKDVDAKHAIGLSVGEDFDEAVGCEIGPGPRVGSERKFADVVGHAGAFELLLGFADRGDFRLGVNDIWNHVVVHVPRLPSDDFGGGNAFFFRFVREHRPGDRVTDGVKAGNIGAEMRVDHDPAAIVFLHADGFEAKAVGVGHAADRDQDNVGLKRFGRAAGGRFDFDLERFAGGVDAGDFGGQLEFDALLLLQAVERARHFAVNARQDVIEKFDDGDLRAKPPPFRAGSDDNVFRFDDLRLAVVRFHFDLARGRDSTGAVKRVDFVLLEQERDAVDIGIDVAVFVFEHGGEIDGGLADFDSHLAEILARLLVQFRSVQQGLRGNAADVEASAAEGRVFLDNAGFQAELRGADGALIAAGASADDNDVVGHKATTYQSSCPQAWP